MARSDMVVLIVEDDRNVRELWVRSLRPHARIEIASTVAEALDKLENCDILLLDWILGGEQTADIVLDRWVERVGGPVCVVSDTDNQYNLYSRGVLNTFSKPIGVNSIVNVMHHYIADIEQRRTLDEQCKLLIELQLEVARLRRRVIILTALLFAVGGWQLVEKLPSLLGLFAVLL